MDQTYCICGQPYDTEQFMIQCDICKEWFHGSCIGLIENLCPDFDQYHCVRCQPDYGVPIQKTRVNWHRHNEYEMNADAKPVQTGTPVFIMELKTRHFPSAKDIIKNLTASEMNINYFIEHGFDRPSVVKNKELIDMKLPNADITHKQLEHLIGGDFQVDVIDVGKQTDIKLKFREFLDYLLKEKRPKILNLISLEFSNTNLSDYVEPPRVVAELDWVNQIWPDPLLERNNVIKQSVQKYLLISSYDSFTDFHIDFGGSSVWYHLLKGQKIFYLIQPTPANLALYQRWMNSSTQSETFFGDQVDMCYQFIMDQGETLLIPTGWIHAVLTPIDSMVVGGNFLHSLNIPLQLQVYEIEKKIKAPSKYRYPNFEITNWFAAIKLLGELKRSNLSGAKCPDYLLHGLKSLIITLKQWKHDGDYCLHNAQIIPDFIDSHKLIKDINKELRNAERLINLLNPPKPERESKRKKRKPINDDFIDFSKINYDQNTKEALKLTIKNLKNNTSSQTSEEERPSLKITIPKMNTNILQKQENSQSLFSENHLKFTEEEKKPQIIRSLPYKIGTKSNKEVHKLKRDAKSESIYDFHDGSDDIDDDDYQKLIIDEKPSRKIENLTSLRLKISNNNSRDSKNDSSPTTDSSYNGIDQLLNASIYTSEKRLQYEADTRSGTTSPSTREAIAGMLSISVSAMSHLSETKSSNYELSDDYGENMDKVHQDEDYIYPTLDTSEDEDPIFKPRGKRQKTDEPWNPKARVGPLVPKINRPAREGTKKQSVEKGLEAAAAKRATNNNTPKRQYSKKSKIKHAKVVPANTVPSPTSVVNKTTDPKTRKPKKGMATPKQRLGKILKIHKLKF